jgi:hypothetical protein
MRILLSLLALLVPRNERPRWREEWRAELQHGGRRMIPGALPDAWAMRRLHRRSARSRIFHGLGHDFRYWMRTLAAAPGFVLGVVLSLTLGIGGNIAAFTFINAAVFRPFPGVHDQHELVRIRVEATRADTPMPSSFLSAAEQTAADGLALLRSSLTTLGGISAHVDRDLVISVKGRPVTGPGALVSSNYFDILGVGSAAGRFFSAAHDDPGTEPVAVISHALWRRIFAGSPGVIGSTLTVNGTTVHVIGVAAEHFIGVRKGAREPTSGSRWGWPIWRSGTPLDDPSSGSPQGTSTWTSSAGGFPGRPSRRFRVKWGCWPLSCSAARRVTSPIRHPPRVCG